MLILQIRRLTLCHNKKREKVIDNVFMIPHTARRRLLFSPRRLSPFHKQGCIHLPNEWAWNSPVKADSAYVN